ncbi:L-2-hydroxyglutarate oxidase [Planctomicrobium sp. SH668]|uniref:L-2-hydroxyglutarate oxidase n=1 Tax=Planctomicrobium sp. SH668 TaxID=3448126 RepID=UPI003F5C8465
MREIDVAIIGGGIVGLATAWQLTQRAPQLSVAVIEKETHVAAHQSGHNSGVLHSGIYYKPGSLRATNCRLGKLEMQRFCEEHGIPFHLCGKVIVAVDKQEQHRLHNILDRGLANGINCELIGKERLLEIEPYTSGVAAIHVPEAGIVDYVKVCEKLAELGAMKGHQLLLGTKVTGITPESTGVMISTTQGDLRARFLVTCGGLWEDRLIKLSGDKPAAQIVPFRGEYFTLRPEAEHLCRTLIYPVPDPAFPFLGVHFTRMIQGGVECGPNAVLAFARDGYRKTDFSLKDLFGTLAYRGFQRMAMKYWKTGLAEIWRSWSKRAFVNALQRLVPEIQEEHLVVAPAGVRAQALGENGSLLDDFLIQRRGRLIHVVNAPSPAATASLNIGKLIVDQFEPDELK